MARQINKRDITPVIDAAEQWLRTCLINDGSALSPAQLWTPILVEEVYHAFVDHPDNGDDDFMTKLKGQMKPASAEAQKLMAEMLWALLLFPSNMKARTKRRQVLEIWGLSGEHLTENIPSLSDSVLVGIGSGGPGFNNYRPDELEFLVELTRDLKVRPLSEREEIFSNYDTFMKWIEGVPQRGKRQFRHMLRYFAFPDRVERMSSNNDRITILQAFSVGADKHSTDRELDDALLNLRNDLQKSALSERLDFYEAPLRDRWKSGQKIATVEGPVTVVVPGDEEEEESGGSLELLSKPDDVRPSFQIQAKLAEVGAIMGFKIWLPPSDKARVSALVSDVTRHALLDSLPLLYGDTALKTIKQIDVIWLNGLAIMRAFEVEHTTAVYSGLLRMADLLALLPNLSIKLHIVAPDERREKVFDEIRRPVFSLLQHGPLSRSCTFISYESVSAMRDAKHLPHLKDGIISDYEERPDDAEP